MSKTEQGNGTAAVSERDKSRRDKLLEGTSEELKQIVSLVEDALKQKNQQDLKSYHGLGVELKEVQDDETRKQGKRYGANAIGIICLITGLKESQVRALVDFAATYSEEQINDIAGRTLADGRPISFSHLKMLATVKRQGRREELFEKMVKESWTVEQTRRAASEGTQATTGEASDRRGRPLAAPKNFDRLLD